MQSSPSAKPQILPWSALVFGIVVGAFGAEAVRAFIGAHQLTTIHFWQHVGIGLGFGIGIAVTFVVLNKLTGSLAGQSRRSVKRLKPSLLDMPGVRAGSPSVPSMKRRPNKSIA